MMLRPEYNGTFVAYVPAIPGCHAWGHTPEEAQAELMDVFKMVRDEYKEEWRMLPANISTLLALSPFYLSHGRILTISFLTKVHYSKLMSASNEGVLQPMSVSIGAKIAPEQAAQIRELIGAGVYLNESDFVRDAIRHRLSEIKVIKCREVDFETAKKEILGYYKSRKEAYPDEAARDLELDFDLVMKATDELRKEGRLVEA